MNNTKTEKNMLEGINSKITGKRTKNGYMSWKIGWWK